MEIAEIKPGDVLFVWGHSLIDDAIEFVTHGPSHCAIFIDNQTVAEAQWGRVTGTSPLSDYLSSDSHLEVWGDKTLTNEERAQMIVYAKSQYGLHYDYLAIPVEFAAYELHYPLNNYQEVHRRICSSYVYNCGKSVNKIWAKVSVPAPGGLIDFKKLTKKGVLTCLNTQPIPNA